MLYTNTGGDTHLASWHLQGCPLAVEVSLNNDYKDAMVSAQGGHLASQVHSPTEKIHKMNVMIFVGGGGSLSTTSSHKMDVMASAQGSHLA